MRPSLLACAAGLLPIFVATACGPLGTESEASEAPLSSAQSSRPIDFEPCPLLSTGSTILAECANVDVPLDWDHPEGRRASFFVKRFRGDAPGPHKQLWLLAGGPGAAGDGFDVSAWKLVNSDPSLDVYIPDHRGTGRSTYLDCPRAMAARDFSMCGAELLEIWGEDGLRSFSTTSAARDIGEVIERTREPGQEVHLYGASYGTYLAQRYLQLFPKTATTVTLDGLCQAGLCNLVTYDYQVDRVGKDFLRECGADAFCASKLGPDPVSKVREALAVVEAGTCAGTEGRTAADFKRIFSGAIRMIGFRNIIPATAYRILRCNADDVAALRTFTDRLAPTRSGGGSSRDGEPPPPPPPVRASAALQYNIALSEMQADPPPTRDELRQLMEGALFAVYREDTLAIYESWPRYRRDDFVGKYPDTTVPILMLNGTLDPATPISFARAIAPHYPHAGQQLIELPRATHVVALGGGSPTTVEGESCGAVLWMQFLANPHGTLDTSCRDRIVPFKFEGPAYLADSLFGTTDLWENDVPAPPDPAPRSAEAVVALQEAIRQAEEAAFFDLPSPDRR